MSKPTPQRILVQLLCICFMCVICMQGCGLQYSELESPEDHTNVSKTHTEFSKMASHSDLPIKYLNEGTVGVSKVEAAMDIANSNDTHARAEMNKQVADLNARRVAVNAEANKGFSLADAFRKKNLKEYTAAMSQIKARETELGALVENKDKIIASLKKETQTSHDDIVSNSLEKVQSETARIDQIKEIHKAMEVEGNANILEMVQASKATRERAAATVQELQAKSDAVKLETQARIDELNEQIKSSEIRIESEANRIKVARESLLKDTTAHVKELRSNAETMKANLASEKFQLKMVEAESTKLGESAKNKEKSENAPTRLEKALAEIDKLRSEVLLHQEESQANYESMFAEIQAKLDDETNEIKKQRANSDRKEKVARAEFVKAEAAARAEAVRQTAIHQEALAEAEKLQIIAEAEAEAAKIRQEMLDEIAAKKSSDKVEIAGNTTEVSQQSETLHTVPVASTAKPIAPRIEPEHIASYRKTFAEVMEIRSQADAHQMFAEATFAEAKTKIQAVKAQDDAIASEKLAIANALEAQARTRFKEMETKLAKEMDVVESKYRQQVAEANSYRRQKETEVQDILSQADAMEQIANARIEKMLAEEESVRKCGQNDIKGLQVAVWAVKERGDAQYSKLITEAKSVAESEEALALQIDAQVDSARRTLNAKLTKIANSIESAERIAQADYQQSITYAEVLQKKAEAEINRTEAQFKMEHAIAKTQIERDTKLALNQSIRAQAIHDRMVANIMTDKVSGNANIDSQVAASEAEMNIVLADNAAKREAAKSQLNAVKARFTARLEQVKAERAIARAGEDKSMTLRRTDLATALADAKSAREDSKQKLEALKEKQAQLQVASLENWSNKLAMFKKPEVKEADVMENAGPFLETLK